MRTNRSFLRPVLLTVLLAAAACGGVDEDTQLTELQDTGEIEQAKIEARTVTAGVFTAGESDCIIDALLARPGLTAGQILDFAKQPEPSGPVAAAYQEVVPPCIDRQATVEPRPLTPELRRGFIAGIKSGDPSITDEQSACLLDQLLAAGLTPRDFTLAGYDQQLFADKVEPLLAPAGEACF